MAPAIEELRSRVRSTDRSPEQLRAVFDWLVALAGTETASWLWWRVFGETDAAET